MATNTLKLQLSKIRRARDLLNEKERELLSESHGTTIAEIVQIAADNNITAAEIVVAIRARNAKKTGVTRASPKKTPKKRGKVAAKYRNPAEANQSWSGRGRMPMWVKKLHEAGILETASILPNL